MIIKAEPSIGVFGVMQEMREPNKKKRQTKRFANVSMESQQPTSVARPQQSKEMMDLTAALVFQLVLHQLLAAV